MVANLRLDFDGQPNRTYGALLRSIAPGKRLSQLTDDERRAYYKASNARNLDRIRAYRNREDVKSRRRSDADLCRDKKRQYDKEYKKRNAHKFPQYYRRYRLKKEYGLSMEEYDAMWKSQHGKCALCSGLAVGRGKENKLHVDHCHKTGRVRALLCHHCNMVLGHCQDNPWLLRKAAQYVERYANA